MPYPRSLTPCSRFAVNHLGQVELIECMIPKGPQRVRGSLLIECVEFIGHRLACGASIAPLITKKDPKDRP